MKQERSVKFIKIASKTTVLRENAGKSYRIMKYDCGKYKGTPKDYFVGEMVVESDILGVYAESRKDKYGKYVQLMCLIEAP